MSETKFLKEKCRGRLICTFNRYIPVSIIILGIIIFSLSDANEFLSFETLAANRSSLLEFAHNFNILSVFIFIVSYIVLTTVSLPGGVWLTLTGGFIFGGWLGGLYVVIGATTGGTMIFLIVRYLLADVFRTKVGTRLYKIEDKLKENAFSYLLFARLVPLFPFWLVNIVPALFNVRLHTYILASFIGIIPGTLVYSHVGAGLGIVFDTDSKPDLDVLFEPGILLPLLSLAALSLAPIIYKKVNTNL